MAMIMESQDHLFMARESVTSTIPPHPTEAFVYVP